MSINIQNQIKNNANQVRQYINGLYEWEQEMQTKQKIISKSKVEIPKSEQKKIEQPIKNQQRPINQQFQKLKRDVNTVSDYYKAWDKFNIDEQLNRLEKDNPTTVNKKPYNPYENTQNNIRAKPKTSMMVKGGREIVKDPTSLKDKGNLHFKSCEYQKAIQCYTQCLQKIQKLANTKQNNELKSIVYSNRAMAQLKLSEFKNAYDDCTKSLQINNKYAKSYLRRATALKKLRRYKQALIDYEKLLEIEKDNQQGKAQSKRIRTYLKTQVQQSHKRLIHQNNFSNIATYRLQIEQIEDDQMGKQQQEKNYLEEL